MSYPVFAGSQEEVMEKGLRHVPDCPSKFEDILTYLAQLRVRAQRHDFTDEGKMLFRVLYGTKPSWRAQDFINMYKALHERPNAAAPPQNEQESGWVQNLLALVAQEECDVAQKYQDFLVEHVEITMAHRNVLLASVCGPEMALLLRERNAIDRQRKYRLLETMQAAKWAREAAFLREVMPSADERGQKEGGSDE